MTAERFRIEESGRKARHWARWGPYLSDRAWGTVREDYSESGDAWSYFPHEHARSRAYRWGDDGLLGWCDNHQRVCFGLALWNERDPILKERLFGLNGHEGNHGEDVKELYYYLDATPTYSYAKALYKYPQAAFPYQRLVDEGRNRNKLAAEFELIDTGVFDDNRYWDIFVEYAKADVEDTLIRVTCHNRGPESARLHLLPTVWFRNTWDWGRELSKPMLWLDDAYHLKLNHEGLGEYSFWAQEAPHWLFTENETNFERVFQLPDATGFAKDAFHRRVIDLEFGAVNPLDRGTKAAAWYIFEVEPGAHRTVHFRLSRDRGPIGIDGIFDQRIADADEFYGFIRSSMPEDARQVERQAFAGLLWSRQYFHYVVQQWIDGDPAQPKPPAARVVGRNASWRHVFAEDVLTMPDKWEYPWFAAWDTSFHMIPLAMVDPDSAKRELARFLREWYMHPNGQIPAYEWAFDDVNPPVHAWACWRVYKIDAKLQGKTDHTFLESVFHKLLMNFTWWVNRKDSLGDNIFEGGFLGLDNIGMFDRSRPLPTGGTLEQSDGTSWMAMYCLNMLAISLELACKDPVYEDIASKFFEHFLHISSAMNSLGGSGLWDETDGFYYDRLQLPTGESFPMRVRSMVGLIPLFAVDTIEAAQLAKLDGFRRRMEWFIRNQPELCSNIASITREGEEDRRLLAICQADRLRRVLEKMLDETEFLSPYGVRSLSRYHLDHPYVMRVDGVLHRVAYDPGDSTTGLFGGNSNWRGPIWFPVNFLIIESLQRFSYYFGDAFRVECPRGSGKMMNLGEVAAELSRRLARLFLRDENGRRPIYGNNRKLQEDPYFRDLILFYEYFHGDSGAGTGASHQTGWTALVAKLLQQSGV